MEQYKYVEQILLEEAMTVSEDRLKAKVYRRAEENLKRIGENPSLYTVQIRIEPNKKIPYVIAEVIFTPKLNEMVEF